MGKRIVGRVLVKAKVGTLVAIAVSGLMSLPVALAEVKEDAKPQERTSIDSAKPVKVEAPWGEAVEGLRMSVSVPNSPVSEGKQPEFTVAFQNIGEKGFVLSMGEMLGNGDRQYPTAVKLILTDAAGKKSEMPFPEPRVAGRTDDYVVSLGAGVSCTLPLRGEEFGLRLAPGKYRVAVVYTGFEFDRSNADRPDTKELHAWQGTVSSNDAAFEVAHGAAEPARPEAIKSDWGKPVAGLQMSIGESVAPTEIAGGPQWPITFWNVGEKDLVLNLGDWDGIAYVMYPSVALILTDASGKKSDLQMSQAFCWDGRMITAPCIVSLRAGAKYTVTTALRDFLYPDDRDFNPDQARGEFRITADYTVSGHWYSNVDEKGKEVLPDPVPMNFWKGTVQSNEVKFTIAGAHKPKAASPLSMSVAMADRQAADAPVILQVNVTNVSAADLAVSRGEWRRAGHYRALLTGPEGKERRVAVSSGEWDIGSFAQEPLKAGDTAVGWLRLTNFPSETVAGPLPSESVFLPPGDYQLKLDRPFWKDGEEFWINAEARFTVVNDSALAKARWAELDNPPAGQKQFARHVLKDTVTPEMRRQLYKDLEDPDPAKSIGKIDWLGLINAGDPKIDAEIAPVLVAALKVHVAHPDPNGVLNNLCYALTVLHPEGAGPSLLKVAVGNFDRNERIFALEALRFYYEDRMADQIAPLLKSTDIQVVVCAARLMAYGGDDRAAEPLIAAAKRKDPHNAAALAWLPKDAAAAQALKEALASDDREFVSQLKNCLDQLPAPAK